MKLAWVANGRLKLWAGGAAEERVSAFADQVARRHDSIQRKNAWKSQGRGARFASWGAPMEDDLPNQVEQARIVAASRGREPDEVLYLLQTRSVSALLSRPPKDPSSELRLYHTADHQLVGLAMSPDQDRIAVGVTYPSGVTNLAMLSRDGNHLVDVTEGDSIDAAPRWAGQGRLVYQSAGIGRDEQGLFRGRGPFAVCALDLARGDMSTLAEDPAFDLLSPAMDAQGTVYYVRRPYESGDKPVPLGRVALDVVLFPFRLARAVLAWLDLFSASYTGKPLITSGPVRGQQGPDEKRLFLLGNVVDVDQARREALSAGEQTPGLVPQSWELVREVAGRKEVVAKGVLAFDLGDDGAVVYTNGRGVFRVPPGGKPELVAQDERVEAVVAL